jgi:hypothetical protein
MPKAKGAAEAGWKTPLHDERAFEPPTYTELGLDYAQASLRESLDR